MLPGNRSGRPTNRRDAPVARAVRSRHIVCGSPASRDFPPTFFRSRLRDGIAPRRRRERAAVRLQTRAGPRRDGGIQPPPRHRLHPQGHRPLLLAGRARRSRTAPPGNSTSASTGRGRWTTPKSPTRSASSTISPPAAWTPCLLSPCDDQALLPHVRTVMQRGIPVGIFDSPARRARSGKDYVDYIGTDNHRGGRTRRPHAPPDAQRQPRKKTAPDIAYGGRARHGPLHGGRCQHSGTCARTAFLRRCSASGGTLRILIEQAVHRRFHNGRAARRRDPAGLLRQEQPVGVGWHLSPPTSPRRRAPATRSRRCATRACRSTRASWGSTIPSCCSARPAQRHHRRAARAGPGEDGLPRGQGPGEVSEEASPSSRWWTRGSAVMTKADLRVPQ